MDYSKPSSSPVGLVHHAASRGRTFPPNSLQGLRKCLNTEAKYVELDIIPLTGGDFALLHDVRLEVDTNGQGLVFLATADEIKKLHHVSRFGVTDEPVSVLSQAIAVIQNDATHLRELQLDLKPFSPPNTQILEDLLMIIKPIKERIRISSVADWVLRHLKVLDPGLLLGFDPLLYFDVNADQYLPSNLPPFRIGPYGYRDDHPLSALKWGTPTHYLASRAEALLAQIPSHTLWYMRAPLIARSLDDGFDWIDFLHRQEAEVVAWTLNPEDVQQASLAQRLTDAGIDRISTDDAPNLANMLRGVTEL